MAQPGALGQRACRPHQNPSYTGKCVDCLCILSLCIWNKSNISPWAQELQLRRRKWLQKHWKRQPASQPLTPNSATPWLLLPLKEAAEQVWETEYFFLEWVFWGHQCDIYWNLGLKGRQSIVIRTQKCSKPGGGAGKHTDAPSKVNAKRGQGLRGTPW